MENVISYKDFKYINGNECFIVLGVGCFKNKLITNNTIIFFCEQKMDYILKPYTFNIKISFDLIDKMYDVKWNENIKLINLNEDNISTIDKYNFLNYCYPQFLKLKKQQNIFNIFSC